MLIIVDKLTTTDNPSLYDVQGGSSALQLVTNRKFRDVSSGIILLAVDTTQGTTSDKETSILEME